MKRVSDFTYKDFYIVGLGMIVFGIAISSLREVSLGLINIIKAPSILISDYMQIGGVGASFVNCGLMILLSAYLAERSKARLTGALISSLFTVAGFSFFGKNLVNSIPLLIGAYMYCKARKLAVAAYMHIICFSTGISPIVSLFHFGLGLDETLGLALGICVGILIGYIIIPLSASMLTFHDGYSLYNVGFALGVIGIIFAGILRMFNKQIPQINMVYTGNDFYPTLFISLLSATFIIYGLIKNRGLKGYDKIYKQSGRLITDYTLSANIYLVLFNIGALGLVSLIFVKACGGIVNGPITGGILTVMGFGVFGKHPKNVLPIMIGVRIASIINMYDPSATPALLTALFSTTIAPIAGEFGILAGIIAGFLHKAVATNIGLSHGGINLYNNGLAGGLVAASLVPLFKNFIERYRRD